MSEASGAPRAWRVQADGSGAQALDVPGQESWPADPDPRGQGFLVVTAEGAGEARTESLWLLPTDGGPAARVFPPSGRVRSPAWSPDGAWLYVGSDRHGHGDVYRVPREGGDPGRLTTAPEGSFEPSPSPDGARLAFGTSRDGNAEIYVLTVGTGELRRVTEEPRDDVRPRWRPGHDEIAWISHRSGAPRAWIGPADGSSARPLRPIPAQGSEADEDVAWSPDGRLAALTVQAGPGEVGVEVVDADAGTVVARIDAPGVDEHPAFSPDGAWIAFSSTRGGDPDLWRVRADGTEPTLLFHGPGADWLPRWVAEPGPAAGAVSDRPRPAP